LQSSIVAKANRFALILARGACRLALRAAVANWSLTSVQQRLVKTGGRLINCTRSEKVNK
jgi:hypothetical protein